MKRQILGLALVGLAAIIGIGAGLVYLATSLARDHDMSILPSGTAVPRESRVSSPPTRPPTDCSWGATTDAWIDANANGLREEDEQPLPGVVFYIQGHGYTRATYQVGNSRGRAQLYYFGSCTPLTLKICAEAPVHYEPTTPNCVWAAIDQPRPVLQFGFRYLPGATPTPQSRIPITCTSYTVGGTHVNDIAFAPDGAAWAAAADGHVARFDPSDQHQTVYTLKDETPYSPSADVVTVAPDGTVWVGTDQGVQRFDGSTWTRYHIGERLIRGAGDIAVASDGLVWVATALDGIWTFDPRMDVWNTQAIDLDELGVDGFSAIEVIPDGSLWFFGGTDIYQLIVPEKAGGQTEWVVHAHKTASKIGEVYYLATDALAFDDQILWIAGMSNQGPSIVRYDPTTQASITYNHYTTGGAMAGGQISSLTTAPDGSVWIGLYENGALHFIPDTHDVARGTWTHYTSDRDGLIRGEITSIAVGPDGAVWFGTDRGTVARCEVHE